jgi:hypothetical protein
VTLYPENSTPALSIKSSAPLLPLAAVQFVLEVQQHDASLCQLVREHAEGMLRKNGFE